MEENNKDGSDELEALEDEATVAGEPEDKSPDELAAIKKSKGSPGSILNNVASRINIYLLLFVLLLVIALIIAFVVIQASKNEDSKQSNVEAQELTQEAIDSLNSNEATVGDPKQLLNIESNAVFAGKVLIRDGLDVAGSIKVGGKLELPGLNVTGKSVFDEVQINALSVSGDTSVNGTLTINGGLTVNSKTSFAAPISAPGITIDALRLTGDIQFNGHIDAGGGTPGVSSGGAVGAGGTVTISGTDTAGTVTVNIGAGAVAGVLANVTFSDSFGNKPHVVITPVASLGSAAVIGTQRFYLSSRTSTSFSIATGGAVPVGSISFDYIVID